MLFVSPTSVHFIFSMKRLRIKRNVLKKSLFCWNLKVSKIRLQFAVEVF